MKMKALLAVQVDIMLATRPGLRQVAQHLASIPGISPFSAAWLLAELGPVARYPSARSFLAYCGCCPRLVKSDNKVYSAHVTRRSNKHVRTILYMAATVLCQLVKEESALKAYARRVVARKALDHRKLAIMTVAAKIARVIFGILQNTAPFSPDLARPHDVAQGEPANKFSVADRKVLRRAKNCLARAGEILTGKEIAGDLQRISAALDATLHRKA